MKIISMKNFHISLLIKEIPGSHTVLKAARVSVYEPALRQMR